MNTWHGQLGGTVVTITGRLNLKAVRLLRLETSDVTTGTSIACFGAPGTAWHVAVATLTDSTYNEPDSI